MNNNPILVDKIIGTESLGVGAVLSTPGRVYTFLNPVSYLSAMDDRELFARFDGVFADGSLLVSAIRLLYGRTVTRRSFDMTSLAPVVLDHACRTGKSVYIVGSRQEEAGRAVAIFSSRWPGLRVAGCRSGYFASDAEMRAEAQSIVSTAPDFLIVGMGVMAQERFLLMVREAGFGGIGFTCGGFIRQTAAGQAEHYYPAWADRLNLRFVYRMYKEKHTRKRYAQAALLFPARFIAERLFG